MRCAYGTFIAVLLLIACSPRPGYAGGQTKKYALLVGCTEYKNLDGNWKLQGPANDVLLWTKLLQNNFGFAANNITVLSDAAKNAKLLPTHDNISRGFEELIQKADDQTQVVILLSGHGSQIPIPETQLDPLDPKNPEPDGLDEIFLPTDVRMGQGGKLENYIIDDRMGVWLDRFRAKGAAVFIIFDCCHSGTMDRGGPDDVERSREIKAELLGVPSKQIEAAVKRAAEAVEKAKKEGKVVSENSPLDLPTGGKKLKGSVVALYAAQSFETAPELPRPRGAPLLKENYYGLLSYTLIKTLEQQGSQLNYRELAKVLTSQYAAERGSRGPTPFFDGDLDREVLGTKTWPKRGSITFDKSKMELSAGELAGLTRGSILALDKLGADKALLGYVQITELAPFSAKVMPCKHGDKAALPEAQLPAQANARLVSRDFGDMKLTYAIAVPDAAQAKRLVVALNGLEKDVRDMVKEVPMAEADWLLVEKYGKLQLRLGEGRTVKADKANQVNLGHALTKVSRVYEICGIAEAPQEIADSLSRDLPRIFTWQALWRVAGSSAAMEAAKQSDLGLHLAITKLKQKEADGPLVSGSAVLPGQRMRIVLENRGVNDVWLALLFLDADFGINVLSTTIKSGSKMKPISGTIDGKTTGKEGIIVLAGPLAPNQQRPDFSFLKQPPLKVGQRAAPDVSRGPQTPFGNLMKAARLGQGTRAFNVESTDNPVMLTWSWVAVNPAAAAKK